MNSVKWTGFVVLGAALLLGAAAAAQDWPQWRGPNRDGKAVDFKAPKAWPKELTKKWSVTVGDGVATPALVGKRLYVFSRQDGKEVIRGLNAEDGEELWKDSYATAATTGGAAGFPGPRSSPAVADGKVVTLGVRSVLSCYDAASGKMLWRKDDDETYPFFFVSSSPIITDGLAIAQIGGAKGKVMAFDLKTGEERWQWGGDGTAYASPALMTVGKEKVLIAENAQSIVAIDLNGKELWKTAYRSSGKAGDYNSSSPLADGDTLIYAGSKRGTKAVKLARKGDQLTATELWSNTDHSVLYNTPVLKDGLLYSISAADVLFCINAKDGKTAWTTKLKTGGRRQSGYGSIVDAGPVLFALNPSGQLLVFEPSAKEYKPVASYTVAKEGTFAYPVIAGNRVFIKDRNSLTLWTIE